MSMQQIMNILHHLIGNLYLDKITLDNDKTLDLYEELLLCLTINR